MIKKYEIYKITNKVNNKMYIGYTNNGVENRLHKHYTNSTCGIDTYFYKAIRKYGTTKYHRMSFRLLPEQLKLLFDCTSTSHSVDFLG